MATPVSCPVWNFVPLILILLSHEMGHYIECLLWRVDASWPYFLPSPTLFGTMGAFIRIRSPIFTRRSLFDIGVSGPIAGFVMLIPFLIIGVSLSRPLPPGAAHGAFAFGAPLAASFTRMDEISANISAGRLCSPGGHGCVVGLLVTS